MTQQILAIIWAQFRITRNHLPRTTFGAVLMWFLTGLWYAMFVAIAVSAAVGIPYLPMQTLRLALPISLLALFLYNQTIPLFTLSTGWALQINKLQVYPIRDSALFSLEVLLRVTSAPETILVLLGGVVGLARRSDVPAIAALCLLLFIPLNLFLQLAAREFVTHAFARNRFREIITIFFVSIGVLPQLLIRTGLGVKLKPYFLLFANGHGTPWQATAALSLGQGSLLNFALLAAWTVLTFALARWQFANGLTQDDSFRGGAPGSTALSKKEVSGSILDSFGDLFQDPIAALVQKELRSLVRMPRVRVMFGMACIFSAVIFLPIVMGEGGRSSASFFKRDFFPFVNLYALLILADVLLLNIFGTDRGAAQLYFLSPTPLASIIKAKNLVAWFFILLQNLLVAAVTPFFTHISLVALLAGFLASAVATIHLMWAGNLLSVMMPRPIDPSSTMRKQGNAKIQLWILLCTLGMAVLVGLGYLARWAVGSEWALLSVLVFEFLIGYVIYRVALDSAVERGIAERERIIDALSKTSSPIGGSVG
jgi:ABC-2 type transport system permease protein